MDGRWSRGTWRALALAVTAAAMLPASVLADGPGGPGRLAPPSGQPDNDTLLSVLTPAEAAFMRRKQDIADAVGGAARSGGKASRFRVQTVECEFDPCESPPAPIWPPGGPPASRSLETRARQQINSYYCGPAAGQVVINLSRGYVFTTTSTAGAQDAVLNYRKQTKVAEYMGTTTSGTGGAALAAGLNNPNAVRKPVPEWVYSYANTGTLANFHNMVVTDVAQFGMPLILATVPHKTNAGVNHLKSWPNPVPGAHHWITLKGYIGLPGSNGAKIEYNDSSNGLGGGTGAYDDLVSVLWQVNDWNQGGHIVW